jgi:hypothetical protein
MEPSTHGCTGLNALASLAFRYCGTCEKDGSNFIVKCKLCGWSGKTNQSRMIHMHYLRSSTQQGKKCILISEVAKIAPDFVNEMWAEWNSKKRVQKVIATPKRELPDGTHLPL